LKHVFVDTNVLIDFLADRRPFSLSAAKLFTQALAGKVVVYVSAVSYNNIFYILRQSLPATDTIRLLNELSEMVTITDVTNEVIQKALKSPFKDFEDAIHYYCAVSESKIEIIVTRNGKDFKNSILPVMTTDEVVSLIDSL
jgi:predicted nucleic acid-binding protein